MDYSQTGAVMFVCDNIGIAGTTPVMVKENETRVPEHREFEARMGIALMGQTNMDEAGFAKANNDPFNYHFHDNYVRGVGKTKEEAVENMKLDAKEMTASLWI